MGGTDVNGENIRNNDPLQLQQMIIFLKAELAKYKFEVKKYKDSYHYSLAEKLEQENIQLANEKNELAKELYKLNQELERQSNDYKKHVQLAGTKGKRYITSIDTVWKTKTDLQPINKQLIEVIKKLKDGGNTNQYWYRKNDRQVSSFHKKLAENKITIEQLEFKLVNLIQATNKDIHSHIEKIDSTTKDRTQVEEIRQYLLKEIEQKNSTIGKLQHEILELKEQNNKQNEAVIILEKSLNEKNDSQAGIDSFTSKRTPSIDTETLMQLDHQIKELLSKSLDYEEKIDAKLLIINDLEHKLNQLTVEIDTIKVVDVKERVLEGF